MPEDDTFIPTTSNCRKLVIGRLGLGWLKDYSFTSYLIGRSFGDWLPPGGARSMRSFFLSLGDFVCPRLIKKMDMLKDDTFIPTTSNCRKLVIGRLDLGWLKDYSFTSCLMGLSFGDWLPPGGARSMRSFVLSLGVRECYSLLNLLVWSTSRLGRTRPRPSLELSRGPGYVLFLTLVSFGDFEFSLDLRFCDIPERV